jgi:uncharacterized protein
MLMEYRAVVAKVDDAVNALTQRVQEHLTCKAGCASCCVDGLSVLPVEAAAIAAHAAQVPTSAPAPRVAPACAFLDDNGWCRIYAVRPLLCRTHGLPLRMNTTTPHASLRIVDDIEVCRLNFSQRAPRADEALDAQRVMALLTVVNARYVEASGVSLERVLLRDLATTT